MNIEELVRSDLHTIPVPADLVAPPDLADCVLNRRRRRHRNAVVAAVAVLAVLAVAVPVALLSPVNRADRGGVAPAASGAPAPSSSPVARRSIDPSTEEYRFVRPGGGPKAILSYEFQEEGTNQRRVFVLDRSTGRYVWVPYYHVTPSPDGRLLAVQYHEGRLGVADARAALTGVGIHWFDGVITHDAVWAPDGSALLATLFPDPFQAKAVMRYDVRTGQVTKTTLRPGGRVTSVGWAENSRDYVVITQTPSALVYFGPDGQPLGRTVGVEGVAKPGGAEVYPPSRRYVTVAAPVTDHVFHPTPEAAPKASIVELSSGQVTTLPAGVRPVGWYDDRTVVALSPGTGTDLTLMLIEVPSGRVVRSVPMPGMPLLLTVQLGPSSVLDPQDRALGF